MVEPTPETAAQIAQQAVDFVRAKAGITLPYDPDCLPVLDTIIDNIKISGATEEEASGLLFALGCFLGEVLVRHGKGRWRRTEEMSMSKVCSFPIVVELLGRPDPTGCNPIGKVFKRFRNGPAESTSFFYNGLLSPQRTPQEN